MTLTGTTADVNPDESLIRVFRPDNAQVLGAHGEHGVPAPKKPRARLIVDLCLALIELKRAGSMVRN